MESFINAAISHWRGYKPIAPHAILEVPNSTTSQDAQPDHAPEAQAADEAGDRDLRQRKISDAFPPSIWLITAIEFCERFAYFGLNGPLQNYVQFSSANPLRPGGLGLGQKRATSFKLFFTFWCYTTPIFSAIVADQYLGRFPTILYSSWFYLLGLIVLWSTSLVVDISHVAAVSGLFIAMFLIGVGTGGIKTNANALVAEQYTPPETTEYTLEGGERVIIDYDLTIQRIFMTFYMLINIGSLSSVVTTELELHLGFSPTFLLPTLVFVVGLSILGVTRRYCVMRSATGSVILNGFKALWITVRCGWDLECAKQSYQSKQNRPRPTPWDDGLIDELRATLAACKVFLFFPFYWVAYSQMLTNFISQAGTMETHGIPNDILTNIDPLTIIILVPILDRVIYPGLRRMGIAFRPLTRITCGFIICSLAMASAAVVQHIIYQSPPCFSFPLAPSCLDGKVPNRVHVAMQVPAYLLIALSEVLLSVTGLEYAFTQAPPTMRSFVMAMFHFTNAGGTILAFAFTPLIVDPWITWLYWSLAVEVLLAGIIFWIVFRGEGKLKGNVILDS